MKLKNLPPFKVGDKITWFTPAFHTKMIVLAVHMINGEWQVTFRWAGLSGWFNYKLFGEGCTEPARYFRRVK